MSWYKFDTGLHSYSDSAGTAIKSYCKRVSLYLMIFSKRRSFFGPKNCHFSRSVTLTGVTVSGEACSTAGDITVTLTLLILLHRKAKLMDRHCGRCEEQDLTHRHRPSQKYLPLLVGHRLCWEHWHAGDQNGSTQAPTPTLVFGKSLHEAL